LSLCLVSLPWAPCSSARPGVASTAVAATSSATCCLWVGGGGGWLGGCGWWVGGWVGCLLLGGGGWGPPGAGSGAMMPRLCRSPQPPLIRSRQPPRARLPRLIGRKRLVYGPRAAAGPAPGKSSSSRSLRPPVPDRAARIRHLERPLPRTCDVGRPKHDINVTITPKQQHAPGTAR
jgi:hypothetical protein